MSLVGPLGGIRRAGRSAPRRRPGGRGPQKAQPVRPSVPEDAMRSKVLLALSVGLLLAADAPRDNGARKELKRLGGAWGRVSGEERGKPLPPEAVKGARLVIEGDRHTVRLGDETIAGTHKVDSTRRPRAIDAADTEGRFKGQTALGIYDLDGDQLKVCFAPPGKGRP